MKMTKTEATQVIVSLIKNSGLEDNRKGVERMLRETAFEVGNVNYFEFEIQGVWGSNCSLQLKGALKKVEFSWSSTTRTLAMASATLDVYQKVIALGAKIQAFFDSVDIA